MFDIWHIDIWHRRSWLICRFDGIWRAKFVYGLGVYSRDSCFERAVFLLHSWLFLWGVVLSNLNVDDVGCMSRACTRSNMVFICLDLIVPTPAFGKILKSICYIGISLSSAKISVEISPALRSTCSDCSIDTSLIHIAPEVQCGKEYSTGCHEC